MSPDDVDSLALKLHDFLVEKLGCKLDEYDDYSHLADFLHDSLDEYITGERNYN